MILSHENGQRQEVLLASVPRVGEHVRTRNGPASGPSYVVLHVLWMEGDEYPPEPSVIVSVRPSEGPRG